MAKKPSTSAGPDNRRSAVNVTAFIVTCLFLFLSVQVSNGGFTSSINKITENLHRALEDLQSNVTYSNYNGTEQYVSDTDFSPKGMAGLYNLTNLFMDGIVPKDILKEGLIKIENGNVQIENVDVPETLKYYWGILLIVLILTLMIVFIPLCGLCFCCCRCCGKCGARSQPADKRRDLCKKIMLGTLLIVLGTALLFCVVCAFASNQQLQDGIDSFPENIKKSVKDAQTYLNATKNQATHLLVNNYQDFSTVFMDTMDNSSQLVMEELESYSQATAMTDLKNFVDTLPNIIESFNTLKSHTNQLRIYASQLSDALRKVKGDLLNTLTKCASEFPECNAIQNNISGLETNIDFNKLPDVNREIIMLRGLNIPELRDAAQEGVNTLTDLQADIQKRLKTSLENAKKQVNSAGDTIKTNLNQITSTIDDFQSSIDENTDPVIKKANSYITDYGRYRYYSGLAISCTLLLVTICIALGLICGICGKRPDGYSDNCCNKGAGSQFLICAVMIMFIFGMLIAAVTLVTFLLGVTSQRVVCYPIRDPENSRVFKLIDQQITFDAMKTTVSEMLTNCHNNKSAYVTFDLKSQFDLAEITKQFNIDEYLSNLDLDDVIPSDFYILSNENRDILERLQRFNPSDNLDQFQDELKSDFTRYSLDALSIELGNLVDTIEKKEDAYNYEIIVSDLRLSILHLKTYDEKLLVPMKNMANTTVDLAVQLEKDLKMGHSSFGEAIKSLLDEIDNATQTLQVSGPKQLNEIAQEFKKIVNGQVQSYLDRLDDEIRNNVGQCGPLSRAINAALTSTCDKIILPWNGFWFSLLWALVLFTATIIISVKLATLYQKYKQYGQYVETRGGGKRSKKKNKKAKRYEDRPQNVGGEVVTREYAAGSHPPDARYADMAPKHWEEFPNGGPPQYQRAPTEYERPPPYYYPGTTGEQ